MKISMSSAKQTRTIVMPIGVPQVVPTGSIRCPWLNLNRKARYDAVRITLIGATGNHPSQYAQPDTPPMCRAAVSPVHGRNDSVANDGIPPVRSGHIVASSAKQKQRKQPAIVITPMRMMPSAPVPWTTYGAMPVTRIVPASPMTNAPHQLVPLARPFSSTVPSIDAMASPRSPQAGPLRAPASGRFVQSSEERQVTLDLPVTHLGVPRMELLALDLGVVVDVVAVGRLAERLAQHVVGDQLIGRVQQGRRQHPDAPLGDLLGRHDVQVVAVRLARVEAAVDAVEPGGQLHRHGQV